jgi:hypothetical protein
VNDFSTHFVFRVWIWIGLLCGLPIEKMVGSERPGMRLEKTFGKIRDFIKN